jgi:glucose uptake protein GlcU
MINYLNIIQLVSGIAAAVLVFVGIFMSVKALNPEKHDTIPMKTTVISAIVIALGLLCYAVTKTCTNLTVITEEQYELWTLYLASAGEVAKSFGFIVFIPVVFRLFKPKSRRDEQTDIPEE